MRPPRTIILSRLNSIPALSPLPLARKRPFHWQRTSRSSLDLEPATRLARLRDVTFKNLSLLLALFWTFMAQAAPPISLHPDNGHYFLFRGKPAVLITSGEHYGAVLNRDFDFVK